MSEDNELWFAKQMGVMEDRLNDEL